MEWRRVQKEIVKKIQIRLIEVDMSTEDLLKKSGVSKSVWSNYARLICPMRIENLMAICQAVELSVRFSMWTRAVDEYRPIP